MAEFKCNQCGLCCKNLHENPDLKDMHNGDGICFHQNKETNLCNIYKDRPLICNVKKGYRLFKEEMSRDKFHEMIYRGCEQFKSKAAQDAAVNERKVLWLGS